MFRRYVAVVLVLITIAGRVDAQHRPFAFKAGIGYDYLSQRYFLDSLAVSGPDTVLTRFALTSEYLNDLKGSMELAYRYVGANKFDLATRLDQTQDITRVKVTSNWQALAGRFSLRWRNQVDWRHQFEDGNSSLGSYLTALSNLKVRRPIAGSTTLWGQAQGERTDFYGDIGTGYDFYRIWGKLGLEQSFGYTTILSMNGFATDRQVSDSTTLDYSAYGVEGSFSGLLSRLQIDLLTRWENRDYNRTGSDDDYSRFELDSRSRVDFGRGYFSGQLLELEITSYDPTDPLNVDYTRLRGNVTAGLTIGSLELAAGPDWEILNQAAEEDSTTEDYLETAGLLELNLVTTRGLFLSAENRVGKRTLDQPSEYQSDFSFYELTLLGNCLLWKHVDLNLLLSSTWEWHDLETEDNRAVLVSAGASYRF